jgi:amino acid adenylation domain-containing protein
MDGSKDRTRAQRSMVSTAAIGQQPKRSSDEVWPLSLLQRQVWLSHQDAIGADPIIAALRLRGMLDRVVLRLACDRIVERHSVLRAAFRVEARQPVCLIRAASNFSLIERDIDELKSLEQVAREELSGFDLTSGPLLRACLLRVTSDEHVLVVGLHPIICDTSSVTVFIRELNILYDAFFAGQADPLPPLKIQYVDYIRGQSLDVLSEALADDASDRWIHELTRNREPMRLPADYSRPGNPPYRCGRVRFHLGSSLMGRLRTLAKHEGVSLFETLLSGWAVLLSRWSAQPDLAIYVLNTKRGRVELDQLIGVFDNICELRLPWNDDIALRDYLAQTRTALLTAFAHRGASHNLEERGGVAYPLRARQLMIGLRDTSAMAGRSANELSSNISIEVLPIENATTWSDLSLVLSQEEGSLSATLEYAAELFERATVEQLVRSWEVLLGSMDANMQSPVTRLPILAVSERDRVLISFNDTVRARLQGRLIHELFEEQVEKTPTAIAVSMAGQSLTYAELNSRSNRLAHYLRGKGVSPNQLVALCVDRGLDMVVALLGILKAGAAYVPLDPAYPGERLAHMLEDSAPMFLLTQTNIIKTLSGVTAPIIILDAQWDEIKIFSEVNPERPSLRQGMRELAYVIYTSGSTGKPKGVMVEHAGVVNLLLAMQETIQITAKDRLLALTTLAFDIAALEVYLPLISGAQVLIAPRDVAIDPTLLARLIEEEKVTTLQATPATWRMLIESGWSGTRGMKALCGGEALQLELSLKLLERVDELWNVYGPTETTIWSMAQKIDELEGASQRCAVQPIGRPIQNTLVYILDRHLEPLPVGVAGELYIGGAGVARGYLNRPALTAERFMTDPFTGEPGARMYRTGDLGKWRSDGSIEYLGRNDHQVKVRGYRIELGEIEAQLVRHEQVKAAVVVARADSSSEKQLVAYVVGDRGIAMKAPEKLRTEIVSEWETLWKDTYAAQKYVGPSFVGWDSSYTGRPIQPVQMQEWLDFTLQRIRELEPHKVLEIGCGAGLLLQHLAPESTVYVGTDISASALEQLRSWKDTRDDLKHVELLHRSALGLQELKSSSFDTVILNSVVQYFPDIEYLLAVIEEAMRLLSPQGTVFIGDVRHLGLLPTFHSSVQLSKAADGITVGQLRRRIERAVAQEKELLIDPLFFQMLPGRVAGISRADVQLKRGRAQNELTRYRYDVVLHTGEQVTPSVRRETAERRTTVGSVAELQEAQRERRWYAVCLRSMPNARLAREVAAQKLIATSDERLDAAWMRHQLDQLQVEEVDPEEFWRWAVVHRYEIQVTWSAQGQPGSFDVDLLDRDRGGKFRGDVSHPLGTTRPWSAYANDPLENSFRQQLIPELREYLKARLPEYMLPSAWMVLKELPLTPNGKVDRQALPMPDSRPAELGQYVAPRTDMERTLAGIWSQVLRVDQVGVQDNFFELGGHSLLIVQMLERLRQVGLRAEVRSVYASATLADLARTLGGEKVQELQVAPNLISSGTDSITPQMLPLVELEPEHIDRIVNSVPGGVGNIQDIYPLAPLQEGILFHHLLNERGGDTYVLPTLLQISSKEKLEELIGSLQMVIDRHDVLRTAVLWEQLPRPVQVVYRHARLPVQQLQPEAGQDVLGQMKELMRPERQRLNLREAPLMRLQVLEGEAGQWYGLLQLHHVVCDNESLRTMLTEVMACVDGRGQGLPEPIPYRNHVAQALEYARRHDAQAFFREKLAEVDEPTAPFGLLDVHGDGTRTLESRQSLEPALARRIRLQARRLSVSAATLFHAAWALVVAHTSGREDVVFGTVLLGRMQSTAGAQRVLGMFINTLPLRLRLHGVSVRELIDLTQHELMELLGHEQASLAEAQRCSSVAPSAPLFTSALNYLHSAYGAASEGTSPVSGIQVLESREWTNYPIILYVDDVGDAFTLTAQTDLRIDPERIADSLRTSVQILVETIERVPRTPALSLPIIPDTERRQLLDSFNATRAAYPRGVVHELFEEQVRRTPEAIALVCGNERLSYSELNGRANQLARCLVNRGVVPNRLVALCVDRGVAMIVGMLGILKAGGAYVPLDPAYPMDRLNYMLKDADACVLLTQERLKERLESGGAQVVVLDRQVAELDQHDRGDVKARPVEMTAQHLAYVIYTSGSTGAPKGVMVEHGGVMNFLGAMQRNPGMTAKDRLLAVTTICFDIAALEIYLPLVSGATVVLASREEASDGQSLAALLERYEITMLQATPATYQLLLNAGWRGREHLKALCGGEALTRDLSRKLLARVGSLWNVYGPTETTIWSCRNQITTGSEEGGPVESIGSPIENTRIYILDRNRELVPIGVPGEIYIAGAGVARGYLNRPDLTGERFVTDPFAAELGARMYRTGDLGRWRADATIEYLGRNDHQVKIRGYRIELGEIEAQLTRHEQVKEAVVVAREDVPGDKRLVAYVTFRDAEPVATAVMLEAVRAHAKAALPDYMVPNAFVKLDHLPHTANGKLNRRALPAPELEAYASDRYEAPEGQLEETLASIWRELLRTPRIGRKDSFFTLGGHSLLAMQAIVRIRATLGIDVPMSLLLEHPTLGELSARIEELRQAHLLSRLTDGETEIEQLLARVASMSESKVQELVRELNKDARR